MYRTCDHEGIRLALLIEFEMLNGRIEGVRKGVLEQFGEVVTLDTRFNLSLTRSWYLIDLRINGLRDELALIGSFPALALARLARHDHRHHRYRDHY
jgi:hypothetical protein